jgi:hypothetical protein
MSVITRFLFILVAMVLVMTGLGQVNPYQSIGKDGKVLPAFGGQYREVDDGDSIQRIGSIMLNVRTHKIVKLLDPMKVYKTSSDNSSSSRWFSVDPLANTSKNNSISPYAFVKDDPIRLIDPNGADWFNYQEKGEKKASWHYQDGHEATYTNTKGKETKTSRGFGYLITYTESGKNSEGATTGTLTLYNQNKAVVTTTGVTGNDNFPDMKPTEKGNYFINLSDRDSKGPQEMNEKRDNPEAFMGIQAIPHRFINISGEGTNDTKGGYDIQGAYGIGRIRLLETDDNDRVSSDQVHGYYIHGKLEDHNWTHGCICNKTEDIFNYFWSGAGKDVRGLVPVSVQ